MKRRLVIERIRHVRTWRVRFIVSIRDDLDKTRTAIIGRRSFLQ